jgi:hypothetical protein
MKGALERASKKLNLGLDQIGELALAIKDKDPRTAVELRGILENMFDEDTAFLLPAEELIEIVKEYQNKHIGSSFDSFLEEEGIKDEVTELAITMTLNEVREAIGMAKMIMVNVQLTEDESCYFKVSKKQMLDMLKPDTWVGDVPKRIYAYWNEHKEVIYIGG